MRHIQKNKKRKGRIPIDQIDIREVLDDLNIYYSESGKNVSDGWIGVTCPWCDDGSNHLGIRLDAGTCSCFKCGQSGTIIKYLADELGSFNKAIQVLGDAVPLELKSFEESERARAIKVELPKEAKRQISKYHAGYLNSRGFDYEELTDKYNLHFCGPYGKWANRIIVPIMKNYRLITFTSIDISDEVFIRYKHLQDELSIIPIKQHLFGLEFTNKHSIIVVEGIFDMFRIGDGAVCTFGTKITSEQKKILSKYSTVKIVFDGDEAGQINGEKLANDLAPFADVKLFFLPEGSDPDKLSQDDIKEIKNT